MEMCYDGALVMPSSYAVMDNDEMTYVEGGGLQMLVKNLRGLWNATLPYRWAWKACGIQLSTIKAAASMTYWSAVAKFGAVIVKVAAFLSRALAVVLTVGAIAAGVYLGNNRVFY